MSNFSGKVPVTVLTGFLGSGKTTLLNQLLAQEGAEGTAVIVNEPFVDKRWTGAGAC